MTWLTVKKIAALCDIDESTVKKAVKAGRCQSRYVEGIGRGGRQLEIALETIPWEITDSDTEQTALPDILQFTGKQREGADFRALVVMEYQHSGLSPEEYVLTFNAENPPEDAITTSKLFRWQRQYKQGGIAALVDQRGGHNRGQDTIPEEAWNLFYSLYMTQQKRKIKLCYDLTKLEFPDIPSVSAFERKVKKIPLYAILYYREGNKAFEDALPSMERSKLDIASNDIWFSDHHLVDTFVKSADGRRVVRPWLTVFFDARSNRVVSFLVRDASPNATAVKQCFRIGVEQYGVPAEVYFDNGKDYRSKTAFSRDYPMSLVNQLGIGMIYAKPYHGQAKTVERFFGTFTDRFSRRFSTYTGCNAKVRPECMQTSNEEILMLAPTMEEYIKAVTAYIAEYNSTPNGGRDALQAVRNLNDEAHCGIVLSGNDKIYRQMLSPRRGYEFEQIRTRIVVRKKVFNEYTVKEMETMFPVLNQECIGYLLKLACAESLRTARKLYEVAAEVAAAQNQKLTVKHLRDTQKQLLGEVMG